MEFEGREASSIRIHLADKVGNIEAKGLNARWSRAISAARTGSRVEVKPSSVNTHVMTRVIRNFTTRTVYAE